MARTPTPDPTLATELKNLRSRIARLENRSAFFNTGLHPNGSQGLDSDNYVPGREGFSLRGRDGYLEVNDIELRGGIIGNDALTSPVRGDVMRAVADGPAIPTTWTTLASDTWNVPAGFGEVAVFAIGKTFALNSTAALDYLYCRVVLTRDSDDATVVGMATPTAATGGGGSGTSIAPGVAVIGFDPNAGDKLRLEVQAHTAFAAWAADPSNVSEITGSLTWYR